MSPLAVSPIEEIERIDAALIRILSEKEINNEQMNALIEEREVCLQNMKNTNVVPNEKRWSLAIKRTQYIHALIQNHYQMAAKTTKSLQKGRKLAQTYKKFE